MEELRKYLLAAAAACFIGVGSGFLALFEPVLEYERQAYELAFQVEQATGKTLQNASIDCSQIDSLMADCKQANHMITTSNTTLEFLQELAYLLLPLGVLLTVLGGLTFLGGNKSEKNSSNEETPQVEQTV